MREKINGFHVALLIYMSELDVTIFSLPRIIAENIGTNGWIALIPLSGIALFNLYLYQVLFRVGEGRSAYELLEGATPKGILIPCYLALGLFWVALGAIVGKNFILLYQILAFQTTNSMTIFFLYCFVIYMLLIKDIYSIVKAVTVFFLMTCSMNLLLPFFFSEWRLIRLTSSFFQGTEQGHSLHGWLEVNMVFVGFEIILFLFPHLAKKGAFKGAYAGHLLVTSVHLIVALVSFGFFSFQELQSLQYPVINTMEYIELPFINRLENLIFTFFLFANILSTVTFCYAGQLTLKRAMPKLPDKALVLMIVLLVFAVGGYFRILRTTEQWLEWGFFAEMTLSFGMPLLLLPIAFYSRKRKAASHDADSSLR